MRTIIVMLLIVLMVPIGFTTAQEDTPPLVKIGEVQGIIADDLDEANIYDSPFRDEIVRLQGVVTNIIAINPGGRIVYGFFLQEQPENSDGDPNTSDGIQVITGPGPNMGDYQVAVGDIITIQGEVEEYYDLTRLENVDFVSLDGQVDNLEEAVPPIELNPPLTTPEAIHRYYERIEGMRVFVPEASIVVAPTHIFTSTNDTEIYIVRADHPLAIREDPFTRRVFRDVHPLDEGQMAENLYRISVEGNILKALAADYNINLPRFNTFDVLESPLTGNIVYAYERYTLQIDSLPRFRRDSNPADNHPVPEFDRSEQFSVASFNVENLYDYYDDPFDREDNLGDTAPNYVPLSLEEYNIRLTKLANQIIDEMNAPDIIGFQEIEYQDVCGGGGQVYGWCGAANNADGMPDVLQDLAIEITLQSGGQVNYAAAGDPDAADERGIAQGFLYRTDRVELVTPTADHPILGERPDDPAGSRFALNNEVANPKAFNASLGFGLDIFSRPALVGLFRVHGEPGSEQYVDVYYSVNHWSSNPEENVTVREAGANYNLDLVNAAGSDTLFVVGGDLNAFRESSEIALLEADLVNVTAGNVPDAADYTYIFAGQAQTLDYLYVTPALADLMAGAYIPHINADYSFDYELRVDEMYRAADHDPVIAVFDLPE
jgi:predicted extracellular nuclease